MVPKSEEYASEPTDLLTGVEVDFAREHQSPHKKCFSFPRETLIHASSSYRHVHSFIQQVAPGAPPTMAPPAYHPYQMPLDAT